MIVSARPRSSVKETSLTIAVASRSERSGICGREMRGLEDRTGHFVCVLPGDAQAGDDERSLQTVQPLIVLNRAGHWGGSDSLHRPPVLQGARGNVKSDPSEPSMQRDGKRHARAAPDATTGPPARGDGVGVTDTHSCANVRATHHGA
jgi:hypothetical protein